MFKVIFKLKKNLKKQILHAETVDEPTKTVDEEFAEVFTKGYMALKEVMSYFANEGWCPYVLKHVEYLNQYLTVKFSDLTHEKKEDAVKSLDLTMGDTGASNFWYL